MPGRPGLPSRVCRRVSCSILSLNRDRARMTWPTPAQNPSARMVPGSEDIVLHRATYAHGAGVIGVHHADERRPPVVHRMQCHAERVGIPAGSGEGFHPDVRQRAGNQWLDLYATAGNRRRQSRFFRCRLRRPQDFFGGRVCALIQALRGLLLDGVLGQRRPVVERGGVSATIARALA